MEIVAAHIVALFLYLVLIVNAIFKKLKPDLTFILAVIVTVGYLAHAAYDNLNGETYQQNYFLQMLFLLGWYIYLQSIYLKVPDERKFKSLIVISFSIILVLVLVFQVVVSFLSGIGLFDESQFYLIGFLMCIGMLFYLEAIVRFLKINYRFAFKHQLFILSIVAIVSLLHFYSLIIDSHINLTWYYLTLLLHAAIPVFLIVSVNRKASIEKSNFILSQSNQTQYFMVVIGATLLIAGVFRWIDVSYSDIRAAFYQAGLLVIFMFIFGFFFLSSYFRSELASILKMYFYADSNDYKKEWQAVTDITRDEKDIYCRILEYLDGHLNSRQSAIYLYDKGALKRSYSMGNGFPNKIKNLDDLTKDSSKISNNAYLNKSGQEEYSDLIILLEVNEDVIGLCWIKLLEQSGNFDSALLKLFETVSTVFAIRLWEIRHREEIIRKDKVMAFNKTMAFLAHDLKNIVAQQQLAYENFDRYKNNPEFLDDFRDTIGFSTNRLNDLISQFRSPSLNPESRTVSLNDIVRHVERISKVHKGRVNINTFIPDKDDIRLNHQILLVIDNLLKNGLEASKAVDAVVFSLEFKEKLIINVQDSGIGMSEEYIEDKLFEPFTTSKGTNGLGIGMYQVKNILDEMNASINVTSTVGRGTTVNVGIPV